MEIRAWIPPARGGSQARGSCIKDFPPGGSGRHLLPEAREHIERNWLQGVRNAIEAHHSGPAHHDRQAAHPETPA
eukprot:2444476-Heterocapsa_arctica.AAC.1